MGRFYKEELMAKDDGHINMKEDYPNDNLLKKKNSSKDINVLADEDDIIIWFDESREGKLIFVNIGNTTISMSESEFYTLTKLCQITAKKLLEIT